MSQQRYFLPDHEELSQTYTREELRRMLLDGAVSRSDFVVDDDTGLSHLLGDLLARAHLSPGDGNEDEKAKAYREFRVDTPLPGGDYEPQMDDEPAAYDDDVEPPMEHTSAGPLSPGEHILHHLHPSWLSFPKTLSASIAAAILAYYCYKEQAGAAYVMISGGLAALLMMNISLERSTTDYYISTKRVEAEFGIVGRNSKEVRICDIRSIDVHQDGFLAVLGVGTLDFSSSGGSGIEVQFKNISNPHRFKKIVRELQG